MASRATITANDAETESKTWFSAAELAELGLPGLPGDKRSIARRAQEERWSSKTDDSGDLLVRPRSGRGGGVEFNYRLLPGKAQIELARRGIIQAAEASPEEPKTGGSWDWFARQSAKTRSEAERRLVIVESIELLVAAGSTKSAAVAEIGAAKSVGRSTLWKWLRAVDGIPASERLPVLAPRRVGGGKSAELDDEIWTIFKSDYLRPEEPTFTSCYDRTAAIAAERGVSMPSERTLRRRLEREIDPGILILRRKGEEALRRSLPAQRRSVSEYRVLEIVNVDGHKFDVFVTPPGGGKAIRPVMVAIQDVRSSKIVGWRIGETESAALARLAFADCFRNFGIPREALLDNGRGFASKWLTGGARTRFRFKIMPEEPDGLLKLLNIGIHWAKPYRGQSKPIERAFRDMCDRISRAPACAGAYTGNSVANKPANYGSRAMGWDEFRDHVAQGIADHNARLGRRGRDYAGRSFNEVFDEGYAVSPCAPASEAQLRLALLAAERKMVNRKTGIIELFGNRYWSIECDRLKGRKLTVRFDPDDLHSEIHLYDEEQAYLATVPMIADVGFLDVEGAKAAAKREADARRRVKEGLEAERLLSAEELAAMQPRLTPAPAPPTNVVRMLRRGGALPAIKASPEPEEKDDRAGAAERMRRGMLKLVEDHGLEN